MRKPYAIPPFEFEGPVSLHYLEDALRRVDCFFKDDHAVIGARTVQEILDEQIARKLA